MGVLQRKKETEVDPVLTRIVEEDKVPWYRKPNLRWLYFMLFPTCMGVELTSGFDSQLINALQIVPSWIDCSYTLLSPRLPSPSRADVCGCDPGHRAAANTQDV